jgi:hypothetical protein
MKELMLWLYGKSARNAHIRAMAERLVMTLKEKQSLEYQELCRSLGIAFDKYQKPKRTFYFVVNPLKKVQLVKEKRVYTSPDRKAYETHYYLDPGAFNGYMTRILEEFRSTVSVPAP